MRFCFEVLRFSLINAIRKPHLARRACVFLAVIAALFVLSACLENGLLRWVWCPLPVLYVVLHYGEPLRRQRLAHFFSRLRFWGYDGRLPVYWGQDIINKYIVLVRFRSTVPPTQWEKLKGDFEIFYKMPLYQMEQSRKDKRVMSVFFIKEELPHYIEWRDNLMEASARFAIGESYTGKVVWDASAMPHGLIGGSTGSGKTGLLRCIIHQAIKKHWNISVLDFKGGGDYTTVERYQDLAKDYGPFIISEAEEARQLLMGLTIEVKGRLAAFKEAGVSNIEEYNARGRERFVPWLLVVDEAAELLDVKPKDKAEKEMYSEIDHYLRTLARLSRAAGVHILMGFIRPSADVLDGQIKNNLLWRVCGYFSDPAASRIVLDSERATELPPEVKGRFIVGEEETQAYYLPVPPIAVEAGGGGEAEREPSAPASPAEQGTT